MRLADHDHPRSILTLIAPLGLVGALLNPVSGQTATELRLPFSGLSTVENQPAFTIVSTGSGDRAVAIFGSASVGVRGRSEKGLGSGVVGDTEGDKFAGVTGVSRDRQGPGVYGDGLFGIAGYSDAPDGAAVAGRYGETNRGRLGMAGIGVWGASEEAGGKGVAGKAEGGANSVGVYGQSTNGMAGFFRGKVTITESLLAKEIFVEKITAAKGLIGGAKLFQIDHPLDPAGKFLNHASVESPEMKDLYDGLVALDAEGTAWVTLPDWFQVLNKDFRYQLTCVGGFASVYIAQEITNNRFRIAGGRPGLKVSWQVTGLRQDAYANAHPLKVEVEKSASERGKYLNPVELGFPESAGLHYQPDAVARLKDAVPDVANSEQQKPADTGASSR
jgi:hypothetical protein